MFVQIFLGVYGDEWELNAQSSVCVLKIKGPFIETTH